MTTGAWFSDDRKYRYSLWRVWDAKKPMLCYCMLNPSTADENENDPTVERCQRRAQALGYGGMFVVNIFAYRSTDPKKLKKVRDPIGSYNDAKLMDVFKECKTIICGWGKHGSLFDRGNYVLGLIRYGARKEPHALKLNKDGSPAHPLYIGYDVKPIPIDMVYK